MVRKGWTRERHRHSMSARGIKTVNINKMTPKQEQDFDREINSFVNISNSFRKIVNAFNVIETEFKNSEDIAVKEFLKYQKEYVKYMSDMYDDFREYIEKKYEVGKQWKSASEILKDLKVK